MKCKKPFVPEKSEARGYILKSGLLKICVEKFFGGGGGKGDLENSRFDFSTSLISIGISAHTGYRSNSNCICSLLIPE